jgi:DNA repair exonuclease SbcCD ATPase subunit
LELEKVNTKMKESLRDITSLVYEFKDVQIQIKQLQQEEEVVNNLYTIFSKELLLLVLQDHLPVLSDIVNSYLAQVVEYQINFSLHKSSTDKLELLAQIFDDKGERDVKSLSGGQRVILKIVWMLAISSYIHSPVLFIDETINNLDADTVAKVSDMLEDFVKSKAMKLYAVTHNQQIQDMKFWDKVIELTTISEQLTVND